MIKHTIELVGMTIFIRTLTYHYVGKCIAENDEFLVLENSSWVADSGRLNTALTTGELEEVEPIPRKALIAKRNVVDVLEWIHDLPTEQK